MAAGDVHERPTFNYELIDDFSRGAGVAHTVGLVWSDMWQTPTSGEPVLFRGDAASFSVLVHVPNVDGPEGASIARVLVGAASFVVTSTQIMGLFLDGTFRADRKVDAQRGSAVAYCAPLDQVSYVALERTRSMFGPGKDRSLTVAFRDGPLMSGGALLAFEPRDEHVTPIRTRRASVRAIGDLIADGAIAAQLPFSSGERRMRLRLAEGAGWQPDGDGEFVRNLWGERDDAGVP